MLGLSPRRRGNHRANPETGRRSGSIPAQAGEPSRCRLESLARYGSIPAQAGEPNLRGDHAGPSRVYPRAGGGTRPDAGDHVMLNSRVYPRAGGGTDRIPFSSGDSDMRVYPRAGGGTAKYRRAIRAHRDGSIPAQAGEPRTDRRKRSYPRRRGSIPAQAGEPDPCDAGEFRQLRLRVYPRAGGGTIRVRSSFGSTPTSGLSPRRRGNRCPASAWVYPRAGGGTCAGSIPAQAGEPSWQMSISRRA